MKQIPTNRLLLETDESNVPIADLYKKAALLRNITDKNSWKQFPLTYNVSFLNIKFCFFKRKVVLL